MQHHIRLLLSLLLVMASSFGILSASGESTTSSDTTEWTQVNAEAEWQPRAGLQVVELSDSLLIMGGRTPRTPTFPPIPGDSDIWGDVWLSQDQGVSWTRILETSSNGDHWPARAYFQALTKDGNIYVLGGQDYNLIPNPACPPGDMTCSPFISVSQFFNDVWKSVDGVNWVQLTDSASWSGRAGLSSVVFQDEIYVMAGSFNDDPAVIGGPPVRVYYNDVWKSADGQNWIQMTDSAAWAPRAGAIVVAKDDYMYLVGGEEGFTCIPGGPCPPYFNDVWRSQDGASWELVTESAPWAPRPGHQCVIADDMFVLWGGFGLSTDPNDPFAPANPMDVWISENGADWTKISSAPWNAESPEEIKYDFDALVIEGPNGSPDQIFTMGGDRETFNFMDPTNYLNVDNDVWRFNLVSLPTSVNTPSQKSEIQDFTLAQNFPNPFNPTTRIYYTLRAVAEVELNIFNVQGQKVKKLVNEVQTAGQRSIDWDGRDENGFEVTSGLYFYQLRVGNFLETKTMNLIR